MPKVKFTKNALKVERDNLKRFSRFLPTLQLKKQQLQMEMRKRVEQIELIVLKERELRQGFIKWLSLFGDESKVAFFMKTVRIEDIETRTDNIAGVSVPVFVSARFADTEYSLFDEDPWIDSAVNALKEVVNCRAEHEILERQHELISRELRITTQRVNLFERVMIPGCRENIRVIQIYLGDQQTAAVGRSKIAKRKMLEATGLEGAAA
ncbi:MAG: V-type ATP synthase subunit D [Victivallales bacterium]|nr:V-type ATP synthase subunit D [Victivallales bacterium]